MDVRIGCVTIQVRMLNEIIHVRVYMSELCLSLNLSMCTLRPVWLTNYVYNSHLAADTAAHLTYCCRRYSERTKVRNRILL